MSMRHLCRRMCVHVRGMHMSMRNLCRRMCVRGMVWYSSSGVHQFGRGLPSCQEQYGLRKQPVRTRGRLLYLCQYRLRKQPGRRGKTALFMSVWVEETTG